MLAEERFGQILDLLNKQRTATVQELCEALGTSESTIRRDLTELDRLGKLNKVHGGATLPDSRFLADEPTMEAKETLLEVIEKFARKRGYAAIYINSIRQDRGFLDKENFIEVSGRTMAKKDVSR